MATRGLGATVIARKLNADGVPAFKSKDGWYQSIIKALLTRHDVIGTFQPHRVVDGRRVPDGDPIAGYFPAAIEKDLFLRVQAMRSNPGRPGRKGNTFANLFTGLCHCTHCGGPMTMKISRVKGNENGRYLVCANYVRGHRCKDGKRHFRYEPFEAVVLDHVGEINLAETLRGKRFDHAQKEVKELIATLTLQLEELRRKEQRLAQSIEDNNQPLDAILTLLKARQTERQSIEAQLQHQQAERQRLTHRHNDPVDTCNRIALLRRAWEKAGDETARYSLRSEAHAAIREFITEIVFDSGDHSAVVIVANGVSAYRIQNGRFNRQFRALAA